MVPKHILVPVDSMAASTAALDYAIELAKKLDARVTVLHAYIIPVIGFPDGALVATAEMATTIMNAAQAAMGDLMEERKACGVKLTPMLHQDDARDAILQVAADVSADLIIMGTHGRRGFSRALLGSVAEMVLRRADVPVLVLRKPE